MSGRSLLARYLAATKQDIQDRPPVTVTVSIPAELHDRLTAAAEKTGRSVSDEMARLLIWISSAESGTSPRSNRTSKK